MSVDPNELLARVLVFLFWFYIFFGRTSKKKPPPLPHKPTYEEEKMADTDDVYDNADSDVLFDTKVKCLEWARLDTGRLMSDPTVDPKKVVEAAQAYWNFIVLNSTPDE